MYDTLNAKFIILTTTKNTWYIRNTTFDFYSRFTSKFFLKILLKVNFKIIKNKNKKKV